MTLRYLLRNSEADDGQNNCGKNSGPGVRRGAEVKAGDFVTAKIDLHYALERGFAEVHKKIVQAGLADGLPKLADPEAIAVMLGDHEGCHAKPDDAQEYQLSRELAKRYGIDKLL